MSAIVTLTLSPSIDKSTTVDHVVPERKLRCAAPRWDPGGGGLNVSRAISHLGGETLAVHTAGGLSGQMLSGLLEAEGIRCIAIPVAAPTRENLHVCEAATGQQYRFNMPGAALTAAECRRCVDAIASLAPSPDYVVLSGSLPMDTPDSVAAEVVRAARGVGARVVLDTSGPALALALHEGAYLCKPNLRELAELSGRCVEEEDHVMEAAQAVLARGWCEALVVSLAAAGAVLATPEGCERLAAPPVRAVSTVGAGDSMVAAMVLALTRGRSLRDAVRYGLAAGSAAVMRPGTQLCRREDTERLFARMPA